MTEPRDSDGAIDDWIFDAIAAGDGQPVELLDVFERIDAAERVVIPHHQMDAAFRRLGKADRIRRAGTAYVDATRAVSGVAVDGLTTAEYEAGLGAYREDFERTTTALLESPWVQLAAAGQPIDIDRGAIEFTVQVIVAHHGGRLGESTLDGGALRIQVTNVDVGAGRVAIVERARSDLAMVDRGPANVILQFTDGETAVLRPMAADH